MKRNTALSRTFTNGFDTSDNLRSQNASSVQLAPLKRIARGVLLGLGLSLCFMANAGSSDITDIKMTPKQYAYYSLNDIKQYKCLAFLYGKESAWNPNARNGSHAGIPQGRSKWLLTATPIQQVEWGLRYIKHRYSTPCNAKDHWLKHNWH